MLGSTTADMAEGVIVLLIIAGAGAALVRIRGRKLYSNLVVVPVPWKLVLLHCAVRVTKTARVRLELVPVLVLGARLDLRKFMMKIACLLVAGPQQVLRLLV